MGSRNTNIGARANVSGQDMVLHDDAKKPLDADFPARMILALVGDKWTTVVLYCLSLREVRRFNELQRQVPEISKKMLVQTLRNLERDGLVERTVYAQVPPKTEYRLTEDGHRVREPIAQLCRWAMENQAFVAAVIARRQAATSPTDRA
jgi:DNA-binding HxlR family transcriptional regulator